MEVTLLEARVNKINNASDCLENNPYIFRTRQYYFILSKNLKCMDKISKSSILLRAKPHIWFITFKE